jgi:predicted enzyme related to lactoylglutathione lyase
MMMSEVELKHGLFSWTDLAVPDAAAGKAFYSTLFGWGYEDRPAGDGMTYTIFTREGKDVAGLFTQPPEMIAQGEPPAWTSYVLVDDVDAVTSRATELGGRVLMAPADVMEAGRMSVIQDPTGAVVSLWQAGDFKGAADFNEPVSLTWNELYTRSAPEARAFYTALLGWTIEDQEVGGPQPYAMISVGDRPNGGVMPITPEMGDVPPHWMVYFAVDDVDQMAGRVAELGGSVVVPPTDIGVGRFAVACDDQGAAFTVFKSGA